MANRDEATYKPLTVQAEGLPSTALSEITEPNELSRIPSGLGSRASLADLNLPEDSEQIDLDEDVYGAVTYTVIYDSFELMTGQDHDELDWKINAYRMFFCLLLLAVNYVLQMGLLMVIYRFIAKPAMHRAQTIYKRYHAEVFEGNEFSQDLWDQWEGADDLCNIAFGNYWFIFMILSLWWLTIFVEVRKTMLLYVRFSALNDTQEPMRILERVYNPEKLNLVMNLLPWMRYILYVVLIIPKMVIAGGLLIVGTIWLAATDSFEDVVLNSVALAFITNIDELIFLALVPFTMSDNISHTKLVNVAVSKTEGHVVEVARGYRDSTLCLVMVVFGVGLYMSGMGQSIEGIGVFPGYRHDVDLACPGYWQKHRAEVCRAGEYCFDTG